MVAAWKDAEEKALEPSGARGMREEEEEEEERDLKAGSKSNGIIMGEAPRIEGFNFGNGCAFARNISGNISGGTLEERSRQKICEFRQKISLSLFFFFDLNALILKSKGREEIDQREIFKFYELLLRNKNIVMIEKNTRKHKY